MESQAGIRASDAERERTVAQLNQHHVDGRLTAEEFSDRVESALAARTRGELDALLTDLPAPVERAPVEQAPVAAGGGPGWRPSRPAIVAMTLLGIALLVGMIASWVRGPGPPYFFFPFFPLFPLIFWGFLLARLAGFLGRQAGRRDHR
jgi:uncharacterized protein DUF1707